MKYLGGVHSSCRARRRGGAGWNKPALPCGPTPGPHEWCVCRLALGSARRAPTRPCTRKCDPQPSSNQYQSQTTVGIPTILPFSYMPTEHACKPQHVPKPTATDPFLYQPSYPMEYVTITAGFLHGRGPNRVNQKRKSKSKEQRERERERERAVWCGPADAPYVACPRSQYRRAEEEGGALGQGPLYLLSLPCIVRKSTGTGAAPFVANDRLYANAHVRAVWKQVSILARMIYATCKLV